MEEEQVWKEYKLIAPKQFNSFKSTNTTEELRWAGNVARMGTDVHI